MMLEQKAEGSEDSGGSEEGARREILHSTGEPIREMKSIRVDAVSPVPSTWD